MLLICNYNSQSNDIALIIMDKRYKLLEIKDIIVFTPRKYDDTRGFFYENFNYKDFFKFSEYLVLVSNTRLMYWNKGELCTHCVHCVHTVYTK